MNTRIMRDVTRLTLTCDFCYEILSTWDIDYLKRVAQEKGWRYDEEFDKVLCFECQEKIKIKKFEELKEVK